MPNPLTALGHLAAAARSIPGRDEASRASTQAAGELEADPPELPAGLEIRWLGVSGFLLSYQGQDLYLDPYLSRTSLTDLVRRRTALPDEATLDRYLPVGNQVAGVLVGHTHFDHAIDAPAVARRGGCKAYGSESLRTLMSLHGLADRAVVVEPRQRYELGPFTVSFTPSRHSRLLLGLAVPYDGQISCEHLDGLCPGAYRCGQVWGIRIEVAGISIYHQGSADLLDDEISGGPVDVFLAGVAGRNFTERYWDRILPKLDPAVVVPTHYDDLFTPLSGERKQIGGVRVDQVPDEVGAISRDAKIAALPRIDDQVRKDRVAA